MSTNDKRPEGQRYTLVYLEKGPPEKDSLNFRARLIAFLSKTYSKFYFELQRGLRLELGARVPNSDNGYYDLLDFFEKGELNAVLDAITIVYRVLSGNAYTNAQNWIEFCNRAFSEENIAWKVDARGGVHPLIDAEFQRSTAAAIAGLDDARLVSVRELIETCTKRLDERPPATRDAIGNVYAAVESLFKLVVDSQQGATLNAEAARQKLGKRLESMHPDGVALDSANHLLKSFCEWLPSAHNYRHGQKEGPPNPPLDFAVHIVSAGMTWTRWLTEMYLAQSPAAKK